MSAYTAAVASGSRDGRRPAQLSLSCATSCPFVFTSIEEGNFTNSFHLHLLSVWPMRDPMIGDNCDQTRSLASGMACFDSCVVCCYTG